MDIKRVALTAIVVGLVMNIVDAIVQSTLFASMFYSRLTMLFKADAPMGWLIFGDFLSALVFVWVFDRVTGNFAPGAKGGAVFGLYAGILINFPSWLFMNMLIVGWPYGMSWAFTLYGIALYVILGAVTGTLYRPKATTPAV